MKTTNRSKINEIDELIQYEHSKQNLQDIDEVEFIIENYKIIEKLNLSNNLFAEITPTFQNLQNLISLDISHNQITKIDNLFACFNLEFLYFSYNYIRTINPNISKLKKLKHFDLRFNEIFIDDTILKNLKYNSELVSICLEGNLNFHFEKLKFECLEILEKLEYLDGIQIYKKKSIKNYPVNVLISTKSGGNMNVKKIKDYIRIKRKDISDNQQLYTQAETNHNTSPNLKYNFTSSYYFFNKNI